MTEEISQKPQSTPILPSQESQLFQISKEEEFLKKNFSDYYKKNFVSVSSVEKREFGYGVFGKKIANRNIEFKSLEDMNYFLREQKPLYFSCSNAKYANPAGRPTSAKGYISSEIVYEFDADDIKTDCKKNHDYWKCVNGHSGKGTVDECPECKGSVSVSQWFCSECLGETKNRTFRLLKFLEDDFGFPLDWVSINFSGKAGYHTHVKGERIEQLGKNARIELVNYITASGIILGSIGFDLTSKQMTSPLPPGAWGMRLKNSLISFMSLEPKKAALITGLNPKHIKELFSFKKEFLDFLEKGVLLSPKVRSRKDFFETILNPAIKEHALPIDRQTSVDISKIVRVPETLHGETGLLAKTISVDALKTFDPFSDAVVFDEKPIKVHVTKCPEFTLRGQRFGPFEETDVELPLFAAIFILGRKKTTLLG
jgi:DNA primase small subunit